MTDGQTDFEQKPTGTAPAAVTPPPRRGPLARLGGAAAVIALFAGMLFWTKLRLVTDVPRAGYAEPDASAVIERDSEPAQAGTVEPDAAPEGEPGPSADGD